MTVTAIVPAAGRGQRFGSPENKIWANLAGKPVIHHTLAALQAHSCIDTVVIVGSPEDLDRLKQVSAVFTKVSAVVLGGATRSESVQNGLASVGDGCEIVLVHDAARPMVSSAVIDAVLVGVQEYGAAVPGVPVSDTIKKATATGVVEATVDRTGLWAVQTPQGARVQLLRDAYEASAGASVTDEAGLLEAAGIPVAIVQGEERNIKITRPEDLEAAHTMMGRDQVEFRTGIGYDVHPLAEGRDLWLGGVRVPHTHGLQGHSDADCLLHAVCDALLGAACLGDIGILFPDTDAAHKDRPSLEFLAEVRTRLDADGWSVVNVDVALLAEAPKIKPYREAMITAMAGCLGISASRINLKATTNEGMGFAGRREGMACWATATIRRTN